MSEKLVLKEAIQLNQLAVLFYIFKFFLKAESQVWDTSQLGSILFVVLLSEKQDRK